MADKAKSSKKQRKFHFAEEDFVPTIGASVLVNGKKKGIIRYIGPVPGRKHPKIGVELELPSAYNFSSVIVCVVRVFIRAEGKNDGTISGSRFFTCEAKHGVFSKTKHVHPNTPLIAATVRVQAMWRRKLSQRDLLGSVWTKLDNWTGTATRTQHTAQTQRGSAC